MFAHARFLLRLAAWSALPLAAAAAPNTNGFLFLDNGQLRLGVNTNWGAGIAWLSESASPRNLVNHFDHGRLIQQSYYGEKDGSLWNKQPWSWNPVQGGDWRGHPAKVLELKSGPGWLHSRSMAKHWASGADLPEVTFEQHVTLTGRLARVQFKMTYSGTNAHPRRDHEIPAVFLTPDLDQLVLYDGAAPWTGGALHRSKPGWPNESRRMTEHWAAYVNTNDWGLGALIPAAERLTCYRYGKGANDPSACSYFAPLTAFAIRPGTNFSYEVWLTIGTSGEIRKRFSRLPRRQD